MRVDTDRDDARRRAILEAALHCFLQWGYAKTSLDDIAKRAHISRPLIYRKFKNKEDIFGAVYDDVFESKYADARDAAGGRGAKRERLMRVYELYFVEPWALIIDAPMANEFYDVCLQVIPEIHDRHERKLLDLTKEILGNKETAEVFLLAADGLYGDRPSVPVLRKRLSILIDKFVG